LPALLSSASNLVTLELDNIFQSACIPPEAIVAGLAVLTRLRTFLIAFTRGTSQPDQWRSPSNPPNRAVLPALTRFDYNGQIEYLEDLLALIDMPLVSNVTVIFFIESFMEEIQVPQLSRFIGRTENLKFAQFNRAEVTFSEVTFLSHLVKVELDLPQGELPQADLTLTFSSIHAPRVVHALGQLASIFSNVDDLTARGFGVRNGVESTEWLLFLCLFPAVESLYLWGDVTRYIASALEDTTEDMVTELLPKLRSLWFDENDRMKYEEIMGSIEQFLSLRQLSGRPVDIYNVLDESM